MTDDARDLECARSGTAESHLAFARIYDRHASVVRALCRRHSPSHAETDDALQETFIRAYKMLERVDNPQGLRSWLYQIAAMVCSERRRAASRRSKHERIAFDGRSGGRGMSIAPAIESTPCAMAERTEQLERLTLALDELPDDERLAIHLYYLEPDPASAANNAIGCSRSAFYKLLGRARERLGSIMTRVNA